MNNLDDMYQAFQEANAQRKRENFHYFMTHLESGLLEDLNKKYSSGNMEDYKKFVDNLKANGIMVFRNAAGNHKVKFL